MSILRLSNVTKSFGPTEVLRGIDLDVNEGEMICLIGASGSGKSTLLRTINLLEPIDEGEIRFEGHDISLPGVAPQPIRRKIGLVFQSFNLFPHMTAVENVLLAPSRVFKRSRKDLLPDVTQLFERFNLRDRMNAYPDQLSGGQQQRVAIVRALAMQPKIMLFDEVTSALDPELVSEVLETLLKLKAQNMTMILATHEMGFAREAADRVCVLDGGKIIETGTPDQIFNAPRTKRAKEFLASVL
ncbi:amino acid ABC transporter ATP-binding protein, PAAT family [Aliiroseovarius sediminilitoris]|uniref:Amino acid ABC transporter ATP-binding protein, PAAT family n=1 Tax=Aliiroseovarius sediminilitoris TaxID=1173584 RepID=A0A1I0QIF4_9RHOB|nr:amino acid ABC transporter ATP-binding protein [Aliiroseovarius sediminilitoris]SEW26430.1 amino acid ABC transporter ATP-binding protein, PAAT family [Aliiroseovarius sediminilitoris]